MAVASALNVPTSLGALGGAIAAGLIIPWATTTGFRNPGAVIVAGIGVAAASTALTQFVLVFSRQSEAMALAAALTGSLTARTWGDALVVWSVLLLLGPVALGLRVDLDLISLGDDVAHGLGSRPAKTRSFALLMGILLTVGAVAAAGPLAFVALTAPHLARGLTGRPAMGSAALVGATTVCLADLAVRHVAFLAGLPVGVLTALIGGLFLGAVLISQIREGSL